MTKPLITVLVPTYNSERTLRRCLLSLFKQNFPKDKVEFLLIDNYSEDKTLEIAQKYPVKILMSRVKDNLTSKMIALRKAKGKYFIYFDSDIDIVGQGWFRKMLKPLEEDSTIVASFCGFVAQKRDPALSRYLSYDTLQRDPVYRFFSPPVESTIVEKRHGYYLCEYENDKIPPSGLCLVRREALLKVWNLRKEKRYLELDSIARLVKAGFNKFAFVPSIGMHHPFVESLGDLLAKRIRNISRNFLHQPAPRDYRWFDIKTMRGWVTIFAWLFYANSIVLPLATGVVKSVKNRDLACMWEPLVSFAETWVIIFALAKYSLFS